MSGLAGCRFEPRHQPRDQWVRGGRPGQNIAPGLSVSVPYFLAVFLATFLTVLLTVFLTAGFFTTFFLVTGFLAAFFTGIFSPP